MCKKANFLWNEYRWMYKNPKYLWSIPRKVSTLTFFKVGTSFRSVAELGTDNGKTEQQPTHSINQQPTPADLHSAFYTRQPTTAFNVTPPRSVISTLYPITTNHWQRHLTLYDKHFVPYNRQPPKTTSDNLLQDSIRLIAKWSWDDKIG
jgi:hypothetical protein